MTWWRIGPALMLAAGLAMAQAPAPKPSAKPAARPAAAKAGLPAYPAVPADAGYRFGAPAAWVKPAPAAEPQGAPTPAPAGRARRDPLVDVQVQLGPKSATATYVHLQRTALDSSVLREVGEPQIRFNPAYQKLVIHQVGLVREGRREDRLRDARIEMMRREQQLERQMIDGVRTALVVISDVRVGDIVDLAYTVEGENPIFEGRYSDLFQLASDAPVDRLHIRVESPVDRPLQVRTLASDLVPEQFEEGGKRVIRVLRERLAAVPDEAATPPWFKVYPALQVTEYASWAEVDQWAQRLFATDNLAPAVADKAAELKAAAATPEQQVALALRFVQDEVRYFSASLGESSHRPKPAARTLAERLGDCKDKTLLLNSLLQAMGVDARPALVSIVRNRGVMNYLPSHDQFDHVISRVVLDGRIFYLDSTLNGQGLSLRGRGYYAYGAALPVGLGDAGPQPVVVPEFARDALAFQQDWDFSRLDRPVRLDTRLKATGLAAEWWRAQHAALGLERLAEALGGAYVRQLPGLTGTAAPEVVDSRETNEWELKLHFEHPGPGRYLRGSLDLEFPSAELVDSLPLPQEARRRYPYHLQAPRSAELRVKVTGPQPLKTAAPPPQQIADRHLAFNSRVEVDGAVVQFITSVERRADEVLPGDLDAYRDRVGRARATLGSYRMRMPLLDFKAADPGYAEIDRRLLKFRSGARPDALWQLMQLNEFVRLMDTRVIAAADGQGRLAGRALAERALANNQLGQFEDALADADRAMALLPEGDDAGAALEARGVALVGLGRLEDAVAVFQRQAEQGSTRGSWLGLTHYLLGNFERAEVVLRDSAANASGEARHFTLLWLYLAAERQGGRGKAAIAGDLDAADASQWGGALLRYLGGSLDRDGLLKLAREKPETERLRLAEAYYFIGQQLVAQGRRADALPWFERTVATQAVPYREFTLAQRELKRGGAP